MEKKTFYLPSLDGLRFMAFVMIFLCHLPAMPASSPPSIIQIFALVQKIGWMGVDLFLCLSSYLIVRLLQQEFTLSGAISMKNYWMRRILRIWPLYFLILTFAFAIMPFLPGFLSYSNAVFQQAAKIQLIPYLFFLGNWSSAFFGYLPAYLGHLWTISLEEQFYVFLPLIFFLSVKSKRICLILLTTGFLGSIVSRVISICFHLPYPFVWTATVTRFEPLVAGVLMALHWNFFDRDWISKYGLLIVFCLILSLAFSPSITLNTFNSAWQLCASAFIAGLMLILSIINNFVKKILSWNFFRFGGRISYGLYIFHLFGINIVFPNMNIISFGDWIWGVVLTFSFVFILSAGSYYLFERPILKFKERYSFVKSGVI